MLEALKKIIQIQELDIKMIRLMRMKKQRQLELEEIKAVGEELFEQKASKEEEITDIAQKVSANEAHIAELDEKLKALEARQSSVKKVDEFNALTQEMTSVEREKIKLEHEASNLLDRKLSEEEILVKINESLVSSQESATSLEAEIHSNIAMINEEGLELKSQRDLLSQESDEHLLKIYERLLKNKKDRVVVPVENRTCSGCHVTITIQQENQVRKGTSVVHCEHCSRILYWPEQVITEEQAPRARRRRAVSA